jgi:predicted NBD/HSP70 family sugar kinase
MYLTVDVGGSKTLFAVFSESGEIITKHKIPTNPDYKKFLSDVESVLKNELKDYEFSRCCCAIPGTFDKKLGLGTHFGNLSWVDVPITKDLSNLLDGVPVSIENDAALGGLSEAVLVQQMYKKVLYVTIGTGIGSSYIMDGKLASELSESEAGHMVLDYEGKLQRWEDFASGHAIKKKYGKLASEIDDPQVWANYAKALAIGLQPLLAVLLPEVVIIGGGVGTHLLKFKEPLDIELKKLENTMVKIPPIIQAKRSEEAVIYGCYEYIKQNP